MKEFEDIQDFVDFTHSISVRDTLVEMGYIKEEDFKGSKISCLFHEENTGSLQITDFFFKCYSGACNVKGDIIKFIQLRDNLTFIEAVRKLANHLDCKIKSRKFGDFTSKKKEMKDEWEMYKRDMAKALKYEGAKSNWMKEQIKSFFPFEVGYDSVHNYLVVAMTNKQGEVVGFTKRRVDAPIMNSKYPKWVHSDSKNSLINECSNIFNLFGSLNELRRTGEVYLTEGPRDTAAMVRSGFSNTIAICGSSNFNDKVYGLIEPIKSIIFAMDGDEAGKKGIIISSVWLIENRPEIVKNSKVIEFPDGMDPYDYSEKNDIAKIERKKIPLIDFMIKTLNIEDLRKILRKTNSDNLKDAFLASYMKFLGVNVNYAEEALFGKRKPINIKKEDDYKLSLLATIGICNDVNIEPVNISEEKARKILKMRFNMEV